MRPGVGGGCVCVWGGGGDGVGEGAFILVCVCVFVACLLSLGYRFSLRGDSASVLASALPKD